MSAIWGCVDLKGNPLPEGLCEAMRQPYLSCRIDRYESYSQGEFCMGCGIQYIGINSHRESIPIFDNEREVVFTADVYISNRNDLIALLCPEKPDIPDGELFYLCFQKWGQDAPKHVYGSYAYALYDRRLKTLTIGTDHTISRCLYYCRQGSLVYFSTLPQSLFAGMGSSTGLNETWAAFFLSIPTYLVLSNNYETPYKDVFRVKAAHYTQFTANESRDVEYWSPKDVRPLRLGSDNEYRERFRALMHTCTEQMLRTNGEVGILLSSGFDSSCVAAFSAPILHKRQKKLLSYTHIPIDEFEAPESKRVICNEQQGVLRLAEMYPNISPRFLSTPDNNGVTQMRELMSCDLFPIKSCTNVSWIYEMIKLSAADGCRIMLSGQYGNATISDGSVETYLCSLLSQMHFTLFRDTLNRYASKMHYRRKRILKHILKQFIPMFFKRAAAGDYLEKAYVGREFASFAGISSKDRRLEHGSGISPAGTFSMRRNLTYDPTGLAHVSDSETKLSLHQGVLCLDPTKDIRIIEFCLSLPMECFVNSIPETRRLTRIYLGDLLPGEVLPEQAPRGSQSPDFQERLQRHWDDIYPELRRICLSSALRGMINYDKAEKALDQLKSDSSVLEELELKQLLYVYSLGVFMEIHGLHSSHSILR